MSTQVICPDCRRPLRVPDTALGGKVRCPVCSTVFVAEEERTVDLAPIEAVPAVRRPSRSRDHEDDRDNDHDPRDRPHRRRTRRQQGSGGKLLAVLLVGGGLLLLLLIGGAIAAIVYLVGQAGSISASDWASFSPPGGEFSVLMPGNPKHESQPQPMGLSLEKWTLQRGNDWVFIVGYFDMPATFPNPNSFLRFCTDAERDGMMKEMAGTLDGERDVSLDGHPGREFVLRTTRPRGMFIERVYFVRRGASTRAYLIAVGGNRAQPGQGEAAKFLDSFRLEDDAPHPPSTPKVRGPRQPIPRGKTFLTDLKEDSTIPGPWPLGKNGDLGNKVNKITVNGVRADKGLGLHARAPYSSVTYRITPGSYTCVTRVAIDDTADFKRTGVTFEVLGDGKSLWKSKMIYTKGDIDDCRVRLNGVEVLELRVNLSPQSNGWGAHSVWIDPYLQN